MRTVLLVALLASSLAAQAQHPVSAKVFGLRPSPGSKTAVYYGDSKSAVVKVLGAPTKTSRFFFEIENEWATVLHYGPNQLYFLHGQLNMAEVHDNRWTIGPATAPGFRVGAALSYTKPATGRPARPVFGSFAVENKPGVSRNFSYSAISADNFKSRPSGVADDDGYEILFDKQGRVAHVFFGTH